MSSKTRGRGRGGFFQYRSQHHPGYAPGGGMNFADDSISFGLRQNYTNFEQRHRGGGRGGGPPREAQEGGGRPESEWAKVVRPLPDGLKTAIVTVNPEEVVCFHGRFHWLSNFYKTRIVIDGNVYPSVEHYYQACKLYMLAGPYHSSQIRRMPDPGSVKVAARRILRGAGVSDQEVEEWKINEGPRILEYGMMHKFVQNSELRGKLLETGKSLLIHAFPNDKVFAAGMDEEKFTEWAKENKDLNLAVPVQLSSETIPFFPKFGDGKNLEGLIIMRIREEIGKFAGAIEKNEKTAELKKKKEEAAREKSMKGEGAVSEETELETSKNEGEEEVVSEDMNTGLVAAMASLSLSVKLPPPKPKPTGPFFKSREEGHTPNEGSGQGNKENNPKREPPTRMSREEGSTPAPSAAPSTPAAEKEKEGEKKEKKDKKKKDKK